MMRFLHRECREGMYETGLDTGRGFGLYNLASSQQPAASSQQPAASSQQPAASSQQPAASSQQPAASSQQPAASSQQPAASSMTCARRRPGARKPASSTDSRPTPPQGCSRPDSRFGPAACAVRCHRLAATSRSAPLALVHGAVLATLLLGSPDLRAAAECSNTPAAGNWIECEEPSTSTSNLNINASSIDIDTSADNVPGVKAAHEGTGNINVNISGTTGTPSTIDTTGAGSDGVEVRHLNTSSTNTATATLENTRITTQGRSAHGVTADHRGNGEAKADLNAGVVIENKRRSGEWSLCYHRKRCRDRRCCYRDSRDPDHHTRHQCLWLVRQACRIGRDPDGCP